MDTRETFPQYRRPKLLTKIVVAGVFGVAGVDALLFGTAGRTDWPAAWILTAMLTTYFVVGAAWFLHADPDLLWERMNPDAAVPWWDRLLVLAFRAFLAVLIVTAAFDAGRFQWSQMPRVLQVLGSFGVLGAFAMIWWCTAVNHFLSSYARIQIDRGHTVVRGGPYRIVRHPMYTSIIVLMFSVPLLLGSWLALAPAASIAVLFIIRTLLEDRMLREGLPGYTDYARQVPARLLPGVF